LVRSVRKQFWVSYLILMFFSTTLGRSVLRPKDPTIPRIETSWTNEDSEFYTLRNSHLEEYPIFKTFNHKFFFQNLLPEGKIFYRYEPKKYVTGKTIEKIINNVFKEIEQKKKKYKDFIILRRRDFNRRKKSGLLILKCKKYPFVVKIFKENPKSFVLHKTKGIIPTFFFYMSGGINRHLLGFTRIKNLQDMQKRLNKSPLWKNKVTMPRKWFILPKSNRWMNISGFNIGKKRKQKIKVPGIYCLVSDWVDGERTTSVFSSKDRQTCMQLCNYLELAIDPHIDNFMIERNTGKVAIVDTEHFLSVVGMRKKKTFRGYFSWGVYLANIALESMFFRTKKRRKVLQNKEWGPARLTYNEPIGKSPSPFA